MEKGYQEAVGRDGGRCRGCGKAYTQVHHIRFRSAGGGHEAENLVCLCDDCHAKAHNLNGNLSSEMLRAVLRTNGTVKGFRLRDCCYSCTSREAADPIGRITCNVSGEEVTFDHVCLAFTRNWGVAPPLAGT